MESIQLNLAPPITRRSHERCSVKRVLLEISQNSLENICEFSEISKNILFTEHVWVTASISRIKFEILKERGWYGKLCQTFFLYTLIEWNNLEKSIRNPYILSISRKNVS